MEFVALVLFIVCLAVIIKMSGVTGELNSISKRLSRIEDEMKNGFAQLSGRMPGAEDADGVAPHASARDRDGATGREAESARRTDAGSAEPAATAPLFDAPAGTYAKTPATENAYFASKDAPLLGEETPATPLFSGDVPASGKGGDEAAYEGIAAMGVHEPEMTVPDAAEPAITAAAAPVESTGTAHEGFHEESQEDSHEESHAEARGESHAEASDAAGGSSDGVHAPVPSKPAQSAPAAKSVPSPVDGMVRSLINFFKAGNIWVSGGVVMVLIGFGFLVSFMSERGILSVEMRIAMAALCGIGMVGFGLFLRNKKPVYAMVMQGGGIGVIYLAVFAAAKLTTMFSPLMALALMCLLMVPAVGLALLQNAQVLAMFGFLGGFAAPILLSSGSGDYVRLFAYYTLLDLAILAICRFRLWRWLNLLGAACSFGVMGTWGFFSYRPGMFAEVEPFLLGFTAIFLCVTLISVRKKDFSFANPPDMSLALGVPLAAVTFQWYLAQDLPHGLSLSALCFGAFFILLAALIWKFWKEDGRRLAEVYLASGALLANLAAPLEFSGAVTSGIWAAEGALTFFFGCRYDSRKVRRAGLGLQAAAMLSFVMDSALWNEESKRLLLESLLLAFSFLSSAFCQKLHNEKSGLGGPELSNNADRAGAARKAFEGAGRSLTDPLIGPIAVVNALVILGLFWYFIGFAFEFIYFWDRPGLYFFLCASASSLAFSIAAKFLNFRQLYWAALVPVFYSLVRLVAPVYYGQDMFWSGSGSGSALQALDVFFTHQYFMGIEGLSWLLFVVAAVAFFRLSGLTLAETQRRALLCTVTLEFMFMLTCSFRALTWSTLGLGPSWVSFSGLFPSFVYVCVMIALTQKKRVAEPYVAPLFKTVPAVLFCLLGGWFVLGMFDPGNPAPLPVYIPFFNPLELQQAFCVAVFLAWMQQLGRLGVSFAAALSGRMAAATAIVTFIWLHSVVVRMTHYYAGVPFGLEFSWDVDLFQVLLTGLWGLCGTLAIVFGHKKGLRPVWVAGVGLIILVTIKLFLKDLSDKSTMLHILSFFIVGGVFLLIGLLAPLPPAVVRKDDQGTDKSSLPPNPFA